jgi:hypothetical protein
MRSSPNFWLVSRRGSPSLRLTVPRVEVPHDVTATTDLGREGENTDNIQSEEGLVFHVQLGYKALALVLVVVLQTLYMLGDAVAFCYTALGFRN